LNSGHLIYVNSRALDAAVFFVYNNLGKPKFYFSHKEKL
jgi:hypothetical protein